MPRIVHKHPLAIRWFHWINFPVLAVMIWSGLLIYWAYDPYAIRIGRRILVPFFPDWFYNWLGLRQQLAKGQAWHFVCQWLFTINGIGYIGYTWLSGEWRRLLPNRHSFREAWQVLLHALHLRPTAPPQGKYNAAQRLAYSAILVMGVGSALTGYAIYKPTQLNGLTWMLGGYESARLLHFALTLGYILFFVVHVVQVVLAGWSTLLSMITGFERKDEPTEAHPTA